MALSPGRNRPWHRECLLVSRANRVIAMLPRVRRRTMAADAALGERFRKEKYGRAAAPATARHTSLLWSPCRAGTLRRRPYASAWASAIPHLELRRIASIEDTTQQAIQRVVQYRLPTRSGEGVASKARPARPRAVSCRPRISQRAVGTAASCAPHRI